MERKTNKRVLDNTGSVLILGKSIAERKMGFSGQVVRKYNIDKFLIQGKVEGKLNKAEYGRGSPTGG